MVAAGFYDLLDAFFFAKGPAVTDELDFQSVLLGNGFGVVSNGIA
jgi:hypothetical protein